jgi:hypothetical protein
MMAQAVKHRSGAMSDELIRKLTPLAGGWTTEALVGGRFMARGVTQFAWVAGSQFMMQRVDAEIAKNVPREWVENSPFPVTSIIGADDSTGLFTMLYTDARHVHRVVNMAIDDRVWKLWRDAPGFFQRYAGTFSADGKKITGAWERSSDGTNWARDFELIYTRLRT